ncbi:MAG TPA: hypothetical protein VN711_02805 [Candidatus Saccharimonadales bacterium]|nr:hypothetical protein [Candidatus Saccharimonadales bacterium]
MYILGKNFDKTTKFPGISMVVLTQPLPLLRPFAQNKFFSLQTYYKKKSFIILMHLFTSDMHTGKLSKTRPMLKKLLPTILESTCFNEGNKPFSEEVLRTEIGHLFEHILLEYLCQAKLADGHEEASFSGTTDWNWNTDPQGTFWITISLEEHDYEYVEMAMEKTQALMHAILDHHHLVPQVYMNHSAFFASTSL